MRIEVQAKPGARRPKIELIGNGVYRVAVHERAHDGEANDAIEAALAEHFGLARSNVRIVSGHSGRRKLVEVDGAEKSAGKAFGQESL